MILQHEKAGRESKVFGGLFIENGVFVASEVAQATLNKINDKNSAYFATVNTCVVDSEAGEFGAIFGNGIDPMYSHAHIHSFRIVVKSESNPAAIVEKIYSCMSEDLQSCFAGKKEHLFNQFRKLINEGF